MSIIHGLLYCIEHATPPNDHLCEYNELTRQVSPHTMYTVYSNVAMTAVYLNAVLSDLCHRRIELAKKMLMRKSMG